MKLNRFVLFGIAIMIFFNSINTVSAIHNYSSGERIGVLNLWIEAFILLFLIIAAVMNLKIISKHKKDVWKSMFIFVLSGIILMILSRLIIVLYDFQIINIGDETLAMGWHIIFYLAMICFLIFLEKVIRIRDKALSGKQLGFRKSDLITLVILGVLAVATFFILEPLDAWFLSWFEGSFIAEIGLHHFIAFLFAGFIAAKITWVKFFMERESYDTRAINSLFAGFIIFLGLMGLNHFWELITESWMIIRLSSMVIETVEQIFWLPASVFLAYGLWRASKIK